MVRGRSCTLIVVVGLFAALTPEHASSGPAETPATPPTAVDPPLISSIARNLDATDPSSTETLIQPVEPRRRVRADSVVRVSREDVIASRTALPCQNVIYHNGLASGTTPFGLPFGGTNPSAYALDDCSIQAGNPNRFICAAQVRTFGFNITGSATYDLTVQLWNACPDTPGAQLISQGTFLALPNDNVERLQTITIDPPYLDDDGTVYVYVQSENPDAGWIDVGDTTDGVNCPQCVDTVDAGTTSGCYSIVNANGTCLDDPSCGTHQFISFPITLYGSTGPTGSCCDLNLGMCSDGVLQGNCNDGANQSWSDSACSARTDCVACAVLACPIGQPLNLENEPDCFTNYVDASNRGCQNLASGADTTFWTPITCGQSGCGRGGTYTFLNTYVSGGAPQSILESRRDDDHYLLALTQDTRVTWRSTARFPSEAIISFTLRQTNGTGAMHCPTYVSTAPGDNSVASAPACQEAVATACLPGRADASGPLRYLLRVRPSKARLGDNTICGLPYSFNLSCESCTLPTGACCTDTGCRSISRLACLIQTGSDALFYHGDGSSCGGVACSGTPSNDTCPNGIALTCASCIVPFDTSFAHSSDTATGTLSGGQVLRDIWYHYQVPQPPLGNCNSGRVVVSTIGACFNSKIQLFKVSNCSASIATQCSTAGLNNSSLVSGGTFVPVLLSAGPPVVNVGPFAYGRSANLAVIGSTTSGCWKIRVGGLTENDFGPGILRVDFKCESGTASNSWDLSSGRCCIWDANTHTMSCLVAPFSDFSGSTVPTCCTRLGGYLRNTTDFLEGATSQFMTETLATGCAALPCPAEGEACFNAFDLNTLFGGPAGSTSRWIKNKLYYKYIVPPTAPAGSGLSIQTCGSNFDTALALYRGFNLANGECDSNSGYNGNSTGCGNIGIPAGYVSGDEIARADDCGPYDGNAAGSRGLAPCFAAGEHTTCICLKVVASGQTPQAGEVRQGDTIWIGVGVKNTLNGSARPFIDPVRADDCASPKLVQLSVNPVTACFSCSVSCPPGATPENETYPTAECTNYVDTTNAGCTAASAANFNFTPITCGQTYCGTSATYRTGPACLSECFEPDHCQEGYCVGPTDTARDIDFYRIQITTAQHLVWAVTSAFPATIQIIASPTNNCADQTVVAGTVGLAPCTTISAEVDACPGWYEFLVEPTVLGMAPCGSIYYASLTCSLPALPACCKGDANNDGIINGADIAAWLAQLSPPIGLPQTVLDPISGCRSVRICTADLNGDAFVDLADLPAFVAALLAPSPCGATVCESPAACHPLSVTDSGMVSDLSTSTPGQFRCADDFKVTQGQTLSKLCWWGFYFDFNEGIACSSASGDSADNFLVTIYSDAGGVPGNVLAGPITPTNLVKSDTGTNLSYQSNIIRRFKYEADLPSPVAVSAGACYWLEIVNHTGGVCLWLWETSYSGGNGVAVAKPGGPAGTTNWYSFDITEKDFAFCLPGLRIDSSDCGLPLGRCCIYQAGNPFGQCTVQTRQICERVLNGRWTLASDCSMACPIVPTSGGCPGNPNQSRGPDVVVADITGPLNLASSGGFEALTFGSDACNLGDTPVDWFACPENTHPVFGSNLYRWSTVGGATRFEQVGQSWLKNGFGADQNSTCCSHCIQYPDQTRLGMGCSDAYIAQQFTQQSNLSPKYLVNAHTGFYPTGCGTHPAGANSGFLEVSTDDLVATNGGSGASVRYFAQHQYIAPDDAAAHNQNNNASSREMAVSGSGSAWDFSFAPGGTQFQIPAIRLWRTLESGVVETDINTPEDDGFPGLVIMAAKATDLGGGVWRYEYAVNNLNSDRSIGSFSVPVSAGASVQNIGFHDVSYRAGDGVGGVNYDGTDWPGAISGGAVTWATTPFATNNNANAIRWGTLYNFRFDANRPPATGNVTFGEFKAITSINASTVVPSNP